MNVLTANKQGLLDRVGSLIERMQGVDFIIPEDSGYFSIEDDLVKKVRALVRDAVDLLEEIMDCYDAEAEGTTSPNIAAQDDEGFLKEIGAQISSQLAVQEVSGLAFVSRGQLLDMVTSIDNAMVSKQIWKVASQVDAALRRAGRALIAIESAIRECEGLPGEYRVWQNLDDSLEVRRTYGEFRRAVLSGDDPDEVPQGTAIADRLRHCTEAIALLRSREIYPYLRIDDRLQIRQLQKRIQTWLRTGDTEVETGPRLWGDLVSFARLLGQVNNRQEIREHDRLAVNGLFNRFFQRGTAPEQLGEDDLALLEPLFGREDELDRIILDPGHSAGTDLKAPLERLQKELGHPFASPGIDAELLS